MDLFEKINAVKNRANRNVNTNTQTSPADSSMTLLQKIENVKARRSGTIQQPTAPAPAQQRVDAFDTTSVYRDSNTTTGLNTSYNASNPPPAPALTAPEPTLRFPTQPKPGLQALSRNLGNLEEGLGKVTGWATEKLGQMIGGAEGFVLGGVTGSWNPKDARANLTRAMEQSKKLSADMGEKGRGIGTQAGALIPGILKRVVDFTPKAAKVIVGREEDMVDYAADKFIEKYNSDIPYLTTTGAPQITKQQAKNYLLTGNFEGDQSATNKAEITKAWASSLFDIGLDLTMISDIAAGALKGYYAKNVNKGYKPFSYTKTDFDNGIIEHTNKAGTKTTTFNPIPGQTGTMEVTAGSPTVGRRLTQDVFPLQGQGRVVAQRTPGVQTALNQGAETATAEGATAAGTAITRVGRELPAAPIRTQVEAPAAAPMLPAGTPGARPTIAPSDNPSAAFQIIDSKKAQDLRSLQNKLQKVLDQKQTLMQSRPSSELVSQVKTLQNTINDIKVKIDTARNAQNVTTGPIVNAKIVENNAKPAQPAPITPVPVKTTPKPVSVKAEAPTASNALRTVSIPEMYHGSFEGALKVDKLGNINLSPVKSDIAQFGPVTTIDTSKMKVLSFPTKEALFDAAADKVKYRGYDILVSGNHAIAINPKKFAGTTGNRTIELHKQKIAPLMKAIPKEKPAPVVKEKAISKEEALRRMSEKKKQAKNEVSAYEKASKKEDKDTTTLQKELKDITAKITDKEKLKANLDKQKTLESKVAVAKAQLTIEQARAKKVVPESKEARLTREEEMTRDINEDTLYKAHEETSGGRHLSRRQQEVVLKDELKAHLAKGKDEAFFRDLDIKYYSDYLEGKTDWNKSNIVAEFIDDNFKANTEMLATRFMFMPSEIANGLDKVWQKLLGDKVFRGYNKFLNKLSEIKIETNVGDKPRVFYPFEYMFGTKMKELRPYERNRNKAIAEASSEALNLARELSVYSEEEQVAIIDKIRKMEYDNTDLGKAAMRIEEKFVEIGTQAVQRGLMTEEAFRESLGKYFPRMFEAFETGEDLMYKMWRKRINKDFAKLKRDKYGLTFRTKTGTVVKKFESKQERDAYAKELRAESKKYETFAPVTQEALDELKEIKSLPYPVMKRVLQEKIAVANYDYFDSIKDNENIVRDAQDIKAGFVEKMPDDKAYGPLRNKFIHQYYINTLKEKIELPNAVDKFLRTTNAIIKGAKTIMDPSVHISNAISNIFLADLAGVPVERADYWVRNLYNSLKQQGAYKELREMGILGDTSANQELQSFIGISGETNELKSMLSMTKPQNAHDIIALIPQFIEKGWIKAGDVYSFSENWAKSTVYDWAVNEMKMPKEQAAEYADTALFNYGDVSRMLQHMRRLPFGPGFPTFAAKMTGRLIETQIRKPFTLAKWILMFSMLSGTAAALYNIDEEDIKKLKPETMNDWFVITDISRAKNGTVNSINTTDFSRYLPWGSQMEMPVGINQPTDLLMNPKFLGAQNMFSAYNPGNSLIFKPLFEMYINQSQFTGNKIVNLSDTPLEKTYKWIDYLERAWGPTWSPQLVPGGKGGALWQKYSDAIQRKTAGGKETTLKEAALRTVGTKTTPINVDDQINFKIRDIKAKIVEQENVIRKEAYNAAAAKKNTDTSQEAKIQAAKDVQEAKIEASKRIKEYTKEIFDLIQFKKDFVSRTRLDASKQ